MSPIGECIAAFIFGSVVGLLVQRSRFRNTAALRDAMLFNTYRNTKALLVAMMILTLGFTTFLTFGDGKPLHFDVGLNQLMGLFPFGIGMVLAGACTVSTWVKAGEGNSVRSGPHSLPSSACFCSRCCGRSAIGRRHRAS